MTDDLTLRIGGVEIRGWTQIRITRGIERVPADFEISMTERLPGDLQAVTVIPGQPCEVLLGSDIVVTGYVDGFTPSIDAQGHQISVVGRGKCADLVDCSAEWPGGQISGTSALDVASKLAAPYGIKVSMMPGVDPGEAIPQFNLILGETAWEIIERVCRYRALIPYELADGSLILGRVGTQAHSSGFVQGQNVQTASVQYRMDQRYSRYTAFFQSIETLSFLSTNGNDGNLIATVTDDTVSRHRQLDIIAEAAAGGPQVAVARANWDKARRWGRSFVCALTTDTWRDSSGLLWQPNMQAIISFPILKMSMAQWVISEVTYTLNEQGTTAQLTLMPPDAFLPEPVLLQPSWIMELSGNSAQALFAPTTGFQTTQQLANSVIAP